jgi:hypothetical protein
MEPQVYNNSKGAEMRGRVSNPGNQLCFKKKSLQTGSRKTSCLPRFKWRTVPVTLRFVYKTQ